MDLTIRTTSPITQQMLDDQLPGGTVQPDGVGGLVVTYPDTTDATLAEEAVAQAGVIADATAAANAVTLQQRAHDALSRNASFLASSPTNADVVSQVKALTRQVNGLIRLQLRELGDISDA